MGCSTPSSKTLKSSLCRSVTGVPNTLVTCAGTSTSAESTRMSALGKMVWPVEAAGRKRGRMETAVSTPDAWNAQQGEHARKATARRAAYVSVRAIGRLYTNAQAGSAIDHLVAIVLARLRPFAELPLITLSMREVVFSFLLLALSAAAQDFGDIRLER